MTVYLDHNATTPVRPEAKEAVLAALGLTGNPSSVHGAGRKARALVEDARDRVAALVGARPQDVVFTSGGTEANNLALAQAPKVFASAVEHASVLQGADGVTAIPVDADGVVDLAVLEDMLADADEPVLVSIMLANNETGVIQPLREVAALAARYGATVHCDAVQAAGKLALDLTGLGVHMLSLSAHKIGGPAGTGALVLAPGRKLNATLRGGGQERSGRAGTENLCGIAGFGAAAGRALADLDRLSGLAALRDRMERDITAAAPAARIFAKDRARLPTTSCLTMPGVPAETQVMAFDLDGFAVSAGAACSSGKVAPSHVLKAMGVEGGDLNSAIRVSLGWTTNDDDVAAFTAAWKTLYSRLGGDSLAA